MSVIEKSIFDELKQLTGEDFIGELIDAFLEDAPNMLVNMQTAINEQDVESFRRNAHSLKSNANTFGALELAELARELESLARSNQLSEVSEPLTRLPGVYDAVHTELKRLQNSGHDKIA